jgi:hypothetical protein
VTRTDAVERVQRERGARRVAIELDAWFEDAAEDPRVVPCRTIDVSETGVRLAVPTNLAHDHGVLAFNTPDMTIVSKVELVRTETPGVVGMRFVGANRRRLRELVALHSVVVAVR